MRITRIKLKNWRNFKCIDVELAQRSFIVGPNASGKSNFLDAIRFFRDIVSVGGGLREAIEKRGGVSKLRCLAARRNSNVELNVELGNDFEKPEWKYKIAFSQDKQRRIIIKNENVIHNDEILLERPNDGDKGDPERLRQTYLEQSSANKAYRGIYQFFKSLHYRHIVPQIVKEPDRYVGKIEDPYGSDFINQIARTIEKTRVSRLKKISAALKFAIPQLEGLKITHDKSGIPHIEGCYKHWRPKAGWQREDQFSDGTLRLIGLLWVVLDGTGPVLLEEPELSLHPEIVRHIPQLLQRMLKKQKRQIFITTHSNELLEDSGIGVDEVLMLIPSLNGTEIRCAKDDKEVKALLDGGLTIADAVIPKVAPKESWQLSLPNIPNIG
ncbi:AAA family ATPase [bacterium]|nr:AAA family ATPase [bacterium]